MDIKTSCLGVLALRPASGYEIRKSFEEGPFSHFAEGGFGSIYPALGRLAEEKLVTFEVAAQEKRPDKKVYHITEAGRRALVETLCTHTPGEDKYKSNFLFMLFFAEEIPAEKIADLVDTRLDFYRAKIEHLSNCDEAGVRNGQDLVREFGVAVYGAALNFLQDHREEFIDLAISGDTAADAAE